MRTLRPFARSVVQIVLFWGIAATVLWLSPSRVALFPASLAAMFLFFAACVNRKVTLFVFVTKRLHRLRFLLFFLLLGAFAVRKPSEIWSLVVLAALLVFFESLVQKLREATHNGLEHDDSSSQ